MQGFSLFIATIAREIRHEPCTPGSIEIDEIERPADRVVHPLAAIPRRPAQRLLP